MRDREGSHFLDQLLSILGFSPIFQRRYVLEPGDYITKVGISALGSQHGYPKIAASFFLEVREPFEPFVETLFVTLSNLAPYNLGNFRDMILAQAFRQQAIG